MIQNDAEHDSNLTSDIPPVCCSNQTHVPEWKPEIRLPFSSEYVLLNGLDWNTEYEVHVVAENQQGKSKPAILRYTTPLEPTIIPGTYSHHPSLNHQAPATEHAGVHRDKVRTSKAATLLSFKNSVRTILMSATESV